MIKPDQKQLMFIDHKLEYDSIINLAGDIRSLASKITNFDG